MKNKNNPEIESYITQFTNNRYFFLYISLAENELLTGKL
jgi:hypothetical protein